MFNFNIDSKDYKNIHFIGIGGISMSGLAEILINQGFKVSGSDAKDSQVVDRLRKLGAEIYIGQTADNIKDGLDLIIYTDAISKDNPEFKRALESSVEMIDRATFLGALMRNYKDSIAVSGTHGKTTTTSMISTILNHSQVDPTILLGGQLKDIGGNVRLGSRDCLLTEACEYKGNILKYFPSIAVIMNVDEDHLDFFKSMDHIVDTFIGFSSNLKEEDYLIINKDDSYTAKIANASRANIISFAIDTSADYMAKDIEYKHHSTEFDLYIYDEFIRRITVKTLGKHNVYNALASITTSHVFGLDLATIIANIEKYEGVGRRLEYKGLFRGAKILDDYAHHPTEIQVTLNALRKSMDKAGKIYCIFQPHTFTRTQKLFQSFTESFKDADTTIVTDIFAARELDDGSIHSKDLARALKGTEAVYLSSFDEIEDYLLENIEADDIVVTMGAGNIYELGERFID